MTRVVMAFGLLIAWPAAALDFGQYVALVDNVVLEEGRKILLSGEYRALVAETLLPITALTFFAFQLLKAALTKADSPWSIYLSCSLIIFSVAIIAKWYDPVTTEAYAFGRGLASLIENATPNSNPLNTITHASELVRTDSVGENVSSLVTQIMIWAIVGLLSLTQLLSWCIAAGVNYTFTILQVIGFLTVPFIFFKWSSGMFTGAVKMLLWCVFMKPAGALSLFIVGVILSKFLELGGGHAWDLTTTSYTGLAGLLAMFGVSCFVLVSTGLLIGSIVGGRDLSVDAPGLVSTAANGISNAARRLTKVGR